MRKAYYRTGQVAEALSISEHLVRRLIECGLLEGERTPGGQNRVPLSEVERLKKEGVPPIPASPEWDDGDLDSEPEEEEGQKRRLLGPPSNRVVNSAENVVVDENQLKKLRIKREMEQEKDWFRHRKKQNAQQKAEEQRAVAEQAARAEAEGQRRVWKDNLVARTLRGLSSDIPPEIYLEIPRRLEEVLVELGPQTPRDVILRSLEEAVQIAVLPWQRRKETTGAIEQACERLPLQARNLFTPTKWQVRAQKDASQAIAKLPNDACHQDKLRVATAAVQPICAEFEDLQLRNTILDDVRLWEATSEERGDAREAVTRILASLPPGTPEVDLERAREQALKPFRDGIQRRKAEADEQQRVDRLLSWHVRDYLNQLENDDEIEFEGILDSINFADKLKPSIRRAIWEKLKKTQLSDLEIETLIEDLIDEYLDEHLD